MKRILLKSEILKSEVNFRANESRAKSIWALPSAAESQAPKEIKKYSSTSEKPYPTITNPTVFTHQPWGLREKRREILEKTK